MSEFQRELQSRENCQRVPEEVGNKEFWAPKPSRRMPIYQPSPTSALLADSGKSNHQGPWCTYCKGSHPSVKCNVVTDFSARRQLLRQKGKCFRCLRNGHLASQCSKECHFCGVGHHASICENSGKEKQSTTQERSAVNNEGVALNPTVASFQPLSTSMFVSSKSSVLLQTARANISKPGSGEQCVNARMVLIAAVKEATSQKAYRTL